LILTTFGRNIQKTLEYSLHASGFVYVCFFNNFSSFKSDTENGTVRAVKILNLPVQNYTFQAGRQKAK